MTDDHESRPDAAAASADADAALSSDADPPRSRTERVVMWSLIVVGLVAVAIEGRHYLAFRRMHSAVRSELRKAETANYEVTRAVVDDLLGDRSPDESKEVQGGRYDLYRFQGLLLERTLCIQYGVAGVTGEPEVLEVTVGRPDAML